MAAYSIEAGIFQGRLTAAAYEGLLLSKGVLLSSERSFSDYVDRSGDENLQKLYVETLDMRGRMEDLKKSYAQNRDEIQELQSRLSLMEASLSQYGSELSEYMGHLDLTYDELQNSLNDNEVVIDFVDHVSEKYGRKYVAFVYRHGWEAPLLVPVCNQKELDALKAERATLEEQIRKNPPQPSSSAAAPQSEVPTCKTNIKYN
jgi:predicted nuclease with TOPRIM domain